METFEEFTKRMGCDSVVVDGRHIFANGAQSNGQQHLEPSSDACVVLRLQKLYLDAKLVEAEAQKRAKEAERFAVETEWHFDQRQSCKRISVDRDVWLYENGARYSPGNPIDPPSDRESLLRVQIQYFDTSLAVVLRKYRQCQNYITTQSRYHSLGTGPMPEPEALEDLKKLKAESLQLQQRLEDAKQEVRQLSGPTPAEQYARRHEANRSRASNIVYEMQQIIGG